jgi:hypothetical protein
MSRVLSPPTKLGPEVAGFTHDCGARVEVSGDDVQHDRDGSYVVCPACKDLPWRAASTLRWKRARS